MGTCVESVDTTEAVVGVIEISLGVRGNGFGRRSGCIEGEEADVDGIEDCTGGVDDAPNDPGAPSSILRISLPCLVLGGGGFLFSPELACETGALFSSNLIEALSVDRIGNVPSPCASSAFRIDTPSPESPASPVISNLLNASTSNVARFALVESVVFASRGSGTAA